ncbi:SPOR domain-containing protein [Robertkochia solimangrovi]|uniref:HU domain-containing protein n=1 Tax=Robertkochia solimangrovi TaxID=2213046 RepID=UPI00117F33D6|nr:SPOR domain-containing protein [Robertkochia solimangrovi]TRZ45991.1 SPOR domain-containing protein [Robertkochia solimangrovi]
MRIEKYISDLLYRYQCVTVPGLGSFLAQHQSARVHETTDAFYPPSKLISFNGQLQSNDGLLTRYIADVNKISYEEAATILEKTVASWKSSFANGEKISMEFIGDLWSNEEGKILFQPSYHINYLTSSFGLTSFVSPSVMREDMKREVIKLEEKAPVAFTPEKRKQRSYLKYAAVFLLAISAGTTGYKLVKMNEAKQIEMVQREAQEAVQRTIQEATFFDVSPLEMPAVTLNLKKAPKIYHIIAGAFRFEENAQKRVDELRRKGFEAEIIGKNKYGLHQVTYASFSEVNEALENLRQIKAGESSEAWLFVDK